MGVRHGTGTTPRSRYGDAVSSKTGSRTPAIIRLVRPRQWLKNGLIFAPPLASGLFFTDGIALRTTLAAVAFCLLSSGVYCINDARDVDHDRQHPVKQFRPIAAGEISVRFAAVLGITLMAGGLLVSAVVNWQVLSVGVAYVALNVAYSAGLKNVIILDLLMVAFGFVLRGLAGAFAIPDKPTVWFTMLALFGSLLLVSGKRSGEKADVGDSTDTRDSLREYSTSYLVFVRQFAAAGCLMAYCLMAFDKAQFADGFGAILLQLSTVPFLAMIMVLALRYDQGKGSAPEDLLLTDRVLQVTTLIWGCAFVGGLYL